MTGFRASGSYICGVGTACKNVLTRCSQTGRLATPLHQAVRQQSIAPLTQETQTKPEGQIHFFPVLFDGRQVTSCMLCCGLPLHAHVENAETSC